MPSTPEVDDAIPILGFVAATSVTAPDIAIVAIVEIVTTNFRNIVFLTTSMVDLI
jgi:hypothetical protein